MPYDRKIITLLEVSEELLQNQHFDQARESFSAWIDPPQFAKTYLSDYYTGAKLATKVCLFHNSTSLGETSRSLAIDSFDAQDQVLLLELPIYLE